MKRIARRLLLVITGLAVLAGVAGLTAYLTWNFTGLGPTPARAAFARRLPHTDDADADFRRYPFFFATNRALRPAKPDAKPDTKPDADFDAAFLDDGKRLGDRVTLGTFDARIAKKLPVAPWAWESEKNIRLADHARQEDEQWFTALRAAVERSPERSVLIVAWGWKDRFTSAALKTAYTAYLLDIDTPVVLFDWPGNQGDDRAGYLASQQVAERAGPDLGRLIARVARETGANKIWLMGSSMGCQTICDAFDWMGQQPGLADAGAIVDHVVFAAPDVGASEFDDRFARQTNALSRHTTAYVSSNDQALLLSEWVNRAPRLGRVAVTQSPGRPVTPRTTPDEDRQFEEASELLDLQAAGASNLTVIDATPVNKTRNLHHYFTDSPHFFDDLYRQLLRPGDMTSRRLYPVRTKTGSTLWILWDQ